MTLGPKTQQPLSVACPDFPQGIFGEGVVLNAGTKSTYLDEVTLKDFPSISIEAEIAEYSWANQGRTDWNSMVDKFHLISALPYADVVCFR